MLADFGGGVHVLCLDGLVYKDMEGGKVMKVKLTAEPSDESFAEPLLLLGVGGDLLSCITGQPVELTAVLVNSPSTLCEVVELLTFSVHQTLGNVVLTECGAEFIPCSGRTFRTHVEIVLPPRVGCTLEVVSGIVDSVTIRNMSCLKFPLDAAKPVIGGKGLSGVAEDRGTKMNEVIQRHHLITLLGGVTCDDFQQCMRISAVPLDLHQHLGHGGRWWKIAFSGSFPRAWARPR